MKLMFFFVFLICFWGFVISVVFSSMLPIPTRNTFLFKQNMLVLVPQGWAFFTRDPREDEFYLLQIKSIDSVVSFTKTNSDKEFYFGTSRKNRTIMIEFSLVLSKIDKNAWRQGAKNKFELDRSIVPDTISLDFHPQNIKGDFYVVRQERLPWAWSKNQSLVMPYTYAKIFIKEHH